MAIAKILADFNLAVVEVDLQTAKFNSPPNFPAIRNTEAIHVWASFHAFSLILDKSGNISEMVRSQDFTFGI